jgi:hypothetical protein
VLAFCWWEMQLQLRSHSIRMLEPRLIKPLSIVRELFSPQAMSRPSHGSPWCMESRFDDSFESEPQFLTYWSGRRTIKS